MNCRQQTQPLAHRVIYKNWAPYLFDGHWRAVLVANDWLRDLRQNPRTKSPATWRDYAYGLGDFLTWCAVQKLSFESCTKFDMEQYIGSLAVTDDSANKRVTILDHFYKWAVKKCKVLSAPFEYKTVRVTFPGFLSARSSRTTTIPTLMRRRRGRELIVVPKIVQVLAFRNAMPTERDKLLVETIMFTGLRVSELCRLQLNTILAIKASESNRSEHLVRLVGKGAKERLVPFPVRLIQKLQHWARLDRTLTKIPDSISTLFASRERQLGTAAVQAVFRKVSRAVGYRINPHLLRHFYACHRLRYLEKIKATNPLGLLQYTLGHSSIATTSRYLHLTDEVLVQIAAEHQDFVALLTFSKPGSATSMDGVSTIVQIETERRLRK